MGRISIVTASPYGNKYLPMIKELGDKIEYCYGIGFPRNYKYSDEPLNKMRLTKISTRVSGFLVKPFCRVLGLPNYYGYLSNVKIFDRLFCDIAAKDESDIVFINPLLCKTTEKCKNKGKMIICEAGNSEPNREHKRIMEEYERFRIKHRYIYGNPEYKNRVNRSLEAADKIVTISRVSEKTYLDAGYDSEKLHFISLAGTDFPIQNENSCEDKEQAFITTAFHSFIKGTHRLLLAWRKAGISDKKLYVVGRLHDDMKEFISRYGPFDNVEFVGHKGDLRNWYKNYDAVGVLLSLSEGAVRVTPEMMSFGFPMITSPDATCDLIEDGYNGKVVDPFDSGALSESLVYFADDWERVRKLRTNVLQSVSMRTMKDFSIELGEYLEALAQNV